MAKIVIVDDHPAIRMAVRIMLENAGHLIIDEVDNGVSALQSFRKEPPDIVVLDIGIPQLDGVEVIKRIKTLDPRVLIVVLSSHTGDNIMLRCYHAGAEGFVSKLDELAKLDEAVHDILRGNYYFPKHILRISAGMAETNEQGLLASLSDRELMVLKYICQGRSNKSIATDMLLSEKTVSTYKRRLMEKLKLNNMVDILQFGKRNNL
ncbi:response regulator [Aeromonas hydrophila]|uniref:response regulator transcription factor n=1 Tax=Aeromonas hydrophila TaxID=644 RepID=UPI001F5318BF|nr:response regulator transcription factor [Aeromonas hydrophila]UUT59987.1 response regulator transcription factor [Aeromonas hydrophila]